MVSSRGWGVMCLDTRAFRLTQGPKETFGCIPECRKGIWDNSASRADVRDASIWHPGFSKFTAVPPPHSSSDDTGSSDGSEGMNGDIDDSHSFIDAEGEDHEIEFESEIESLAGQQIYPGSLTAVSFSHNLGVQEPGAGNLGAAQLGTSPPGKPSKPYTARTESYTSTPVKPSEPKLPHCAIIHTSETDIRFLQDPMGDPTVECQQPLTQNLPPNLQWLDGFDRLNMLAQIPELGIVAVASQSGRVALLTLTRMTMTNHLAFRLDLILPLRSQEEEGLRPNVPLLGLAIGPIQGREMTLAGIEDEGPGSNDRGEAWRRVERSRRYRLMLTYYDHTVLSYEIEPPCTAASSAENELLVL